MHVTGKDDRASRRVAPSLLCVPSKVAPLRPFKGCSFAYLERSLLCVPSKVAPLRLFKGRSFASLQRSLLCVPSKHCPGRAPRLCLCPCPCPCRRRTHTQTCLCPRVVCVRARVRRQMSIGVCFAGSAWYSRLKYLASAPAALPPLEQVNVPPPLPPLNPPPWSRHTPQVPAAIQDHGHEKQLYLFMVLRRHTPQVPAALLWIFSSAPTASPPCSVSLRTDFVSRRAPCSVSCARYRLPLP